MRALISAFLRSLPYFVLAAVVAARAQVPPTAESGVERMYVL